MSKIGHDTSSPKSDSLLSEMLLQGSASSANSGKGVCLVVDVYAGAIEYIPVAQCDLLIFEPAVLCCSSSCKSLFGLVALPNCL